MANETIMLAKNLDVSKLSFPCAASEKLDGVPGVFTGFRDGTIGALTRQGETLKSVDHIRQALYGALPEGHELIGELYIPGMSFKDIGGLVRKQSDSPELMLYVWDYNVTTQPELTYRQRMEIMVAGEVGKRIFDGQVYDEIDIPIRIIEGTHIANEEALHRHCQSFMAEKPESEGLIFRPLDSTYQAGKRSWGFQRFKYEATADLMLIGFEEAVEAKTGKGKNMAGRLVCLYKGEHIGVGPGNLTHEERTDLYENWQRYTHKIIEVAYKPDPSYDALREPRFKRFRDDKTEANIE